MSYFGEIKKIEFEGKGTKNPLAYKHYNPNEIVMGKTMKDHLRFSVAYWHTLSYGGSDPFGENNMVRPWNHLKGMDLAKARMDAAFELFTKLDVPYYAFHDRDIAPEGNTIQETNHNLDVIISQAKELMKATGVKLLWNTVNMFTNQRFVHGAATTSNAQVYAYAAAQTKKALETAVELGAENFVFWGGREGYESLLNTDVALETDNLARFYHMVMDYAKEIGFHGQFLIEPKPMEPTKHQYDFDTASAIGFLQKHDLQKYFKFNIEGNHATLAGHTFDHELRICRTHGMLGSIDANQGDVMLGWDTDEFPTDIYAAVLTMYEILKSGGFTTGGVNFDAKVRRSSFEADDLFYAHIAGIDTYAKGLKVAAKLIEDKFFENIIDDRYSTFKSGIGLDIVAGKTSLRELEKYAFANPIITNKSGRIERIKAQLNEYIFNV